MKSIARGCRSHRNLCFKAWICSVLLLSKQHTVLLAALKSVPTSRPTRRSALVDGVTAAFGTFLQFNTGRAHAAENLNSEFSGILIPGGKSAYDPRIEGEWTDPPVLHTKLGHRIGASTLDPLQQPVFGDQELYYAPFLFGAWNATATLRRKIYPFGPDYLPSNSLLEGSPRNRDEQVGHSCTYPVHYFSTLANTLANQLTVNLGTGIPETRIIQDRAFNVVALSNAYRQLAPVQDVQWDYRDNPTKLTLDFGAGPLAPDMRPLGPRRAEVFLNARASEYDEADASVFCAAERSRSVVLAAGSVDVSDTETITEFTKLTDDHVVAVSRIAVYPVPNPNSREGVLWQQVFGRAVAFYDYEIDMHRTKEVIPLSDGTTVLRACVTTPRDVIQCE